MQCLRIGGRFAAVVALLILIAVSSLFGEGLYFERRDFSAVAPDMIRDVTEDDRGCLWVATPGGMIRYDGIGAELYGRKQLQDLPSDDIRSIDFSQETSDLWIGTSAGVIRYNLVTERTQVMNFRHDGFRGGKPEVNGIAISGTGEVFAATPVGIYRWSRGDSMNMVAWESSESGEYLVPDDITASHAGEIWTVANGGLWQWSPEASRFKKRLGLYGASAVYPLNDLIWIGSEAGWVVAYNPDEDISRRFRVEGAINGFSHDEYGHLWVATADDGLKFINMEDGSVSECSIDPEHPYRLPTRRLSVLFSGSSGHQWVGTVDSGLFSVDPDKPNYLTHTRRSGAGSLPSGSIHVIHQDSLGYLWAGSDVGGLVRIDTVFDNVFQYIRKDEDMFSINGDHISDILEDSSGRIWVGTDRGPVLYIPEVDGFESPGGMLGGWPDFQGRHVTAMAEGVDGSIWMSFKEGDLYRLDALERDFLRFPFSAAEAPTALHVDRYGSLWVGSKTGLMIFNNEGRLVKTWNSVGLDEGGIHEGGIVALETDATGSLWIGSTDGLALYEGGDKGFREITLASGEAVGVTGIMRDASGKMWVSNGREVYQFDTNTEHVNTISWKSGFTPSGRISGMGLGRDGEVFVGASGEIWTFEGEVPALEIEPTRVYLAGIKVLNSQRATGREMDAAGTQHLSPGENVFTIDYEAVDFRYQVDVGYEYKLSGFLDEWVDVGDAESVTFAKLPAGDYRFAVRAYGGDGQAPGPETTVELSVDPIFWITPWAIGLYILAAAGVTTVIIKLREGNLLKNQVVALEEARTEVLRANKKLEFLTMNDSLTGLLNRRGFDQALDHALTTAGRNNLMISLFMMDVDSFKPYNDNYGHVKGDEVLRGVGKALRTVFERSTDIIARYGGEEFAVVFIGENPNATVTLANDLAVAIRDLGIIHEFSKASDLLTLSAGSATVRVDSSLTSEELIMRSDKALYFAKENGRNRICYTGIIPALPDVMKNGNPPLTLQPES